MWSGFDHDVGMILESTMQRNGEEDINTNIMYNIRKERVVTQKIRGEAQRADPKQTETK